jgi:putative FmdB family regulatory protein
VPIYEYICPIHSLIEVWQGIRERALETCPDCDSPIERQISLPSGYVLEPKGHFVPAPGLDKKGRWNEVKISPQESARQDNARRDAMMASRDRAIKQGFTPRQTR